MSAPLVVSIPHRLGREAAITVVAKCFAPFTDSGRTWPRAEAFDAALDATGYSVEGFAEADATQLRLSDLFRHLPAAVLKARLVSTTKPARKPARVPSLP